MPGALRSVRDARLATLVASWYVRSDGLHPSSDGNLIAKCPNGEGLFSSSMDSMGPNASTSLLGCLASRIGMRGATRVLPGLFSVQSDEAFAGSFQLMWCPIFPPAESAFLPK